MTGFEIVFLYGSLVMYGLGTLAAGGAARSGDRRRLNQARLAGVMGALYQIVVLVLFGARTGHFPIDGAFEAFLFLSAAVMVLALVLDGLRRLSILVIGTLPLAMVTTLLALAIRVTQEEGPPPAGVSSPWTALHIFVALGAYGAFAFAFVTGILYLVAQRRLKDHALPSMLGLMPSLETVARLNVRSIAAGVALLAGGIVVGYFYARQFYQRQFDRLDPKIILSCATLAAYLVLLALSRRPSFRGRRTALGSVLGFFLVMANFWASIFWSDLHRYR
jgi:ABC-type transport system involved in cytochrome c biogenesis permease subunit